MYWLLSACLISAQISDHVPSCPNQKPEAFFDPPTSTLTLLSPAPLRNLTLDSIGRALNIPWNWHFFISSANLMVWATVVSYLDHWESHWLSFDCLLTHPAFNLHMVARVFLKYGSKHGIHSPAQNPSQPLITLGIKPQILTMTFKGLHGMDPLPPWQPHLALICSHSLHLSPTGLPKLLSPADPSHLQSLLPGGWGRSLPSSSLG